MRGESENTRSGSAEMQTERFFEALHHRYYQKLLRQANAYFGYKRQYLHLAENAVQETFELAFESFDSFRAHPQQEAWLRLVLRRRLYACLQTVLTDEKHTAALDEQLLSDQCATGSCDDMEAFLQDEENRQTIDRLMAGLSDKEKNMIELYYFKQYSAESIAALYHTKAQVVNTQLYRIRKKMKKIYESSLKLLMWLLCFYI